MMIGPDRGAARRLTTNSDDPAVSRITLSGEYSLAERAFGMARDDFVEMLETAGAGEIREPAYRWRVTRYPGEEG